MAVVRGCGAICKIVRKVIRLAATGAARLAAAVRFLLQKRSLMAASKEGVDHRGPIRHKLLHKILWKYSSFPPPASMRRGLFQPGAIAPDLQSIRCGLDRKLGGPLQEFAAALVIETVEPEDQALADLQRILFETEIYAALQIVEERRDGFAQDFQGGISGFNITPLVPSCASVELVMTKNLYRVDYRTTEAGDAGAVSNSPEGTKTVIPSKLYSLRFPPSCTQPHFARTFGQRPTRWRDWFVAIHKYGEIGPPSDRQCRSRDTLASVLGTREAHGRIWFRLEVGKHLPK